MFGHVQGHLVALIKIIEVHILLHVSKREHECLSAAQAYEIESARYAVIA
jgi:hypothetical protein